MTDNIFYVPNDNYKISHDPKDLVAAKFAVYNSNYVPNQNLDKAIGQPIYDANGNPLLNANPKGYLIVPANFDVNTQIGVGASIRDTMQLVTVGTSNVITGFSVASGIIIDDFRRGGSQDLQRSYNGTTNNTFVDAFRDAASFNLGLISSYAGMPLNYTEFGGGLYNGFTSISRVLNGKTPLDTSGSYFNAASNDNSIVAGYNFGSTLLGARVNPLPNPSTMIINGDSNDLFNDATVDYNGGNFTINQNLKIGGSKEDFLSPNYYTLDKASYFTGSNGTGAETKGLTTLTSGLTYETDYAGSSNSLGQIGSQYLLNADGSKTFAGYSFSSAVSSFGFSSAASDAFSLSTSANTNVGMDKADGILSNSWLSTLNVSILNSSLGTPSNSSENTGRVENGIVTGFADAQVGTGLNKAGTDSVANTIAANDNHWFYLAAA